MEQKTQEKPDIKSGLVRIAYSAVPQSLAAILISSIILSYIQWDFIPHTTIIVWFVFTNCLSLIRFLAYKKFRALDIEMAVPDTWGNFIFFSAIASGISWGIAGIWLFPVNDIAHQVLLVFVLAGMCAGAVATLSPMLSSLSFFVVLAIVPTAVRFLFVGTEVAIIMAIMAIIFTVILLMTARNLNKTIKESLLMRHEQRLANEIIEHQAFYDPLTNLPNRRLLIEKIKQEKEHAIRHKKIGAVLFLDLDYFKTINDSMGHGIGDELLKQVAERLKSSLRKEDTTARLGGDEFIILISDVGDDIFEANNNIHIFADKILSLFDQEFEIQGQTIYITTSIGVSFYPVADSSPEELIQKSDVAMYEAKAAGKNKMRLFEPEMQQQIISQREMVKGLHSALINNELELYYQPLHDDDGKVFSVEALLRWNHPEKGSIPPADFIDLAEKRGLIIPIGDWVLEQACNHLSVINETRNISMSINVSPRQFGETSFVEKMLQVLSITEVDPANVRLEITESMVMKNVEHTIEKMKSLTREGIKFSIDDFGTGYSSLAYLKRLPVELLKIDKSFVLDIVNDNDDAAIVETILAMAHLMKIDVIAEGVETDSALAFLKSKGCRKFQGYLFNRPMPFDKLIELIN